MVESDYMNTKNVLLTESYPLTVLHIAPTPFFSDRGCHVRIRGIIHALEKKSVDSILCTYHLGRDIEGIETIRTHTIPGYTKLEAGPSAFKYLADILLFFKVCSVIRERRPDVIHCHLHEGVLIGWAARLFFFWRRIPLVFDVQGSLVGELEAHGYFKKSRLLRRMFWAIEYLISRMPDRFVCSSQNSIDILENLFKVNAESISLVNDGVDLFPDNKTGIASSDLVLPVGKAVVIYTGALLESKGLVSLFEVMLEAKNRNLDCHFLIVGYPEQVMKDFCEKNDMQDICSVIGRVPYERLGDYLRLADIAVEPKFSSSGEASGKLLNYMGAGLPVACFDTASNRQILGDAGYFATPGVNTELADRIELLVREPALGREQGAVGRRRVEDRFSWNAGADRICAVYYSCLTE